MPDNQYEELSEAIAIIGMSGRFPGASNIEEFWQNLKDGTESASIFSGAELEEAGVPSNLIDHPNYVPVSAVIDDIEQFDSQFFSMSQREAEITDPQQRIFLECAWEAFENAGYIPDEHDVRVSVYAGCGLNTYLIENLLPNSQLLETFGTLQLMISNKADFLPTMVSYKLNLTGESINVNTACSTSLVAIHMACRSLLAYECDMALAGGISVTASQKRGYMYQPGGVYSVDGRCYAFDARAQGTIPGNGAGVVVLKRLDEALADGDNVVAVIRASAVNNDGSTKVGFTAPGIQGQRDVITSALALSEVSPDSIGYIETHGTGTALGDPVEIHALAESFATETQSKGFCAIGSIKPNVGHLDSAAGVAGLIKSALCLRNKTLVPSLNYESAPSEIDFPSTPFYVNTELQCWKSPTDGAPRRAAVSSFGIGGTNAHAILEEARVIQKHPSQRQYKLLTLSAMTDSALKDSSSNLARHIEADPDLILADAAYTLHQGRKEFSWRQAIIASDGKDAIQALYTASLPKSVSGIAPVKPHGLTFMFSGIGDHYQGMCRNLYREEPVFRHHLDRCAELLQPLIEIDLIQLLFPPTQNDSSAVASPSAADPFAMIQTARLPGSENSALDRTEYLHPALFALEYSLAQLWIDWVGQPDSMVGYSLGEYTAACVAGVMSLEDALVLVSKRARLIQALPAGRMLAVALPDKECRALLPASLSVAAINGQAMTVVAGPVEAVRHFECDLKEKAIASMPVQSEHAFHSLMMDEIQEPLQALFSDVTLRAPTIPYITNRTGRWITDIEATDPVHWASHTQDTVCFSDCIATLSQDSSRLLLEVGPGQALCSMVQQQSVQQGNAHLISIPSLPGATEASADSLYMARALGSLWCAGHNVNWSAYHKQESRCRVPLPTYPFERTRHWIDRPGVNASITVGSVPQVQEPSPVQEVNLTPNIPSPVSPILGNRPPYESPTTDFELAVVDIWQELFHADNIGVQDNFLTLGGTSLMAVQFFTKLRAMYQIELPLKTLFQAPTVKAIATEIEAALLAELEGLSDEDVLSQLNATTEVQITDENDAFIVPSKQCVLPNGLTIKHFNQVETDHFYHDIFDNHVYCRNGIRITDDSVIFDIGANIGLFSLYASRKAAGAKILCFEPAPPVFDLLSQNIDSNRVNAHAFNCGLSNRSGERKLTYYPLSTGMSSFHADVQEEKSVLQAIMQNQADQGQPGMEDVMGFADEILEQRFRALEFDCQLMTVSEVMRQQDLNRIDLMKIDVQKSELEVLQGIDNDDWPLIKQIVIEVHDLDGRVEKISTMLRGYGYSIVVEQELLYEQSNISIIYALQQ